MADQPAHARPDPPPTPVARLVKARRDAQVVDQTRAPVPWRTIMAAIGATAAARPREAALIAGVYSAAVAGTIAYFAMPGWNLGALAASLRRVALSFAGKLSFGRASRVFARRTRVLRSGLGVGLVTLAIAMAGLGYHIATDPEEDVFERGRQALVGEPTAWTVPLVLALLTLAIYLCRRKLRAPGRS